MTEPKPQLSGQTGWLGFSLRLTTGGCPGISGIPDVDREGRRFSPHSARKWFRTALVEAGVQETLIGCLMRHFSGLPARYTQPCLTALYAGLCALPEVWPEKILADSSKNVLTSGGGLPKMSPAKHGTPPPNNSDESSGDRVQRCSDHASQPDYSSGTRSPRGSSVGSTPGLDSSPAIQSARFSDPAMPKIGSVLTVDSIADLLEATARLIRGVGGGTGTQSQARP